MARQRNYKAEYQRRNELAQERGFKSYGQQRRYVEYTGEPTKYLIAPPNVYIPRYDYDNYVAGEDAHLDVFLRMARHRGMDDEEAYDKYMRKSKGGQLSRTQLVWLEIDEFDLDRDEVWY